MKRRTELDLCRICACVMVMVIHTGAELYLCCAIDTPAFAELNFISTMVRGGLPVFFMLSGELLLTREELALAPFLKKHVLRLVGLFFFWSALYALGSSLLSGGLRLDYDFFLSIARGHYHMWFLPAIVVCYLFMPPVSCALHGRRLDARYLLLLFFVFGLLWRNLNLTPEPTYILNRITLNFSLEWLPYLGYAVWGWWLGTRKLPKQTRWLAPLAFLLCTALASRGNLWYSCYKATADGWLFHYLSLPSFVQASCIFCFFLSFRDTEFKRPALWRSLSDCTLGVYLLHPLVMKLLSLAGISPVEAHPALSVTLYTLLLALLCFSVTAAARQIPLVKKLF